MFSLMAPCCRRVAKVRAFSLLSSSQETMMREGYRLSYSALDSRRNSGLKMMFLVWYFYRTEAVNPTGMVDLMIIVASGFTFRTSSMTASTAEQSKKFFLLS